MTETRRFAAIWRLDAFALDRHRLFTAVANSVRNALAHRAAINETPTISERVPSTIRLGML
jgi:hypothetical protein